MKDQFWDESERVVRDVTFKFFSQKMDRADFETLFEMYKDKARALYRQNSVPK